ncbi:hypothetical protein M422DRAFT_275319 [Sphaerobolus stellatus SS14]|uniref:Uncharacterized protein n=1 Tax=Sphaerobolus stellatus (strain SS14) TaxID=990650 RepID=A0A0C9T572_SPHS4|nr:hypothetical protein M422DRAFT_275319 [Sphaerobolus stellatus SS14]
MASDSTSVQALGLRLEDVDSGSQQGVVGDNPDAYCSDMQSKEKPWMFWDAKYLDDRGCMKAIVDYKENPSAVSFYLTRPPHHFVSLFVVVRCTKPSNLAHRRRLARHFIPHPTLVTDVICRSQTTSRLHPKMRMTHISDLTKSSRERRRKSLSLELEGAPSCRTRHRRHSLLSNAPNDKKARFRIR